MSKAPKVVLVGKCKVCGTKIQRNGIRARWKHQRTQPSGDAWDHNPIPEQGS